MSSEQEYGCKPEIWDLVPNATTIHPYGSRLTHVPEAKFGNDLITTWTIEMGLQHAKDFDSTRAWVGNDGDTLFVEMQLVSTHILERDTKISDQKVLELEAGNDPNKDHLIELEKRIADKNKVFALDIKRKVKQNPKANLILHRFRYPGFTFSAEHFGVSKTARDGDKFLKKEKASCSCGKKDGISLIGNVARITVSMQSSATITEETDDEVDQLGTGMNHMILSDSEDSDDMSS